MTTYQGYRFHWKRVAADVSVSWKMNIVAWFNCQHDEVQNSWEIGENLSQRWIVYGYFLGILITKPLQLVLEFHQILVFNPSQFKRPPLPNNFPNGWKLFHFLLLCALTAPSTAVELIEPFFQSSKNLSTFIQPFLHIKLFALLIYQRNRKLISSLVT
jgi:hypothetical protein